MVNCLTTIIEQWLNKLRSYVWPHLATQLINQASLSVLKISQKLEFQYFPLHALKKLIESQYN